MRQRLDDLVEFWRFLLQRFLADRAINSAAALTYTTLFAVVPVMTVTFAMLSAVPAFQDTGEQIQNFIFRNFVPSSGETVQQYLRDFTTQARHLTRQARLVGLSRQQTPRIHALDIGVLA